MDQFLLCNPVGSPSFLTYVSLAVLAAALAFIFLYSAIRSGGRDIVVWQPDAKIVKVRGSVIYAVLSVAVLALMIGFSWIDHKFDLGITPYPQRMDLQAGETLGRIRDGYVAKSSRTILLTDGVEREMVTGAYEGTCAADMFYKICLRMGLSCDWSGSEPTLRISKSPGRPAQ